jgi:hypothetical protein
MALLLDNALRRQLEIPATYGHLIFNCLDLFAHSEQDIEQHWSITADEAYRLGIRSVPSLIGNLVAAQACAEKFGSEVLERVPGFYHFNRLGSVCYCNEFSKLCVCDLPAWRLDIDSCWSKRGLIVPQRNSRGWFGSLKVFRHAQDPRPFTLKVRREIAA